MTSPVTIVPKDYGAVPKDGLREMVESIVIAFVLAFLFKTFEAEAFVIPTGSMAPTLKGLHFDVQGDLTGYRASYGTSTTLSDPITACVEPFYNYPMPLEREQNPKIPQRNSNFYPYSGDRILVSKVAYLFNDPDRWDVVVFKYPGEAQINFIKRLVGLPNETVRVYRGDVLTAPKGEAQFAVQQKPGDKMLAMMQPVFDSDYTASDSVVKGLPQRFVSEPAPAFQTSDSGKSFELAEPGAAPAWLRYQHLVPTPIEWKSLLAGDAPTIPPRLITDACPYNTGSMPPGSPIRPSALGVHWVGDLMIGAQVDVRDVGPTGALICELIKGGRKFQARIDLSSGTAELFMGDQSLGRTSHSVPLVGTGSHSVKFSNVDSQLRLWVDDVLIEFGDANGRYEPWEFMKPNGADLSPASIGVQDAKAMLSTLQVWRDIYYIAGEEDNDVGGPLDFGRKVFYFRPEDRESVDDRIQVIANFYANPEKWDIYGEPQGMLEADYPIEEGEFFMLGDNSPRSADGREWGRRGIPHFVERRLLIGKALLIYWPHGWEFPWHYPIKLGDEGGSIRVPFYPDFSRIFKLIK